MGEPLDHHLNPKCNEPVYVTVCVKTVPTGTIEIHFMAYH